MVNDNPRLQDAFDMRKFVTVLAAIVAGLGLFALGWLLHPATSPQPQIVASATTAAGRDSAASSGTANEGTSSAPIQRAPPTHVPMQAHTAAPKIARQSQPKSALRNINPDAPPWTSDDTNNMIDAPIDPNLALNLFADRIAREENNEDDDDKLDIPHLRRKLERALPDVDTTSELRADLDSWWAQLPPAQQAHIAIALAECRGDYCRVLIAINGVKDRVVGNRTVVEFPAGIDMRALQWSLMAQPWWKSMLASDEYTTQQAPAQQAGYLLLSLYFKSRRAQ